MRETNPDGPRMDPSMEPNHPAAVLAPIAVVGAGLGYLVGGPIGALVGLVAAPMLAILALFAVIWLVYG